MGLRWSLKSTSSVLAGDTQNGCQVKFEGTDVGDGWRLSQLTL